MYTIVSLFLGIIKRNPIREQIFFWKCLFEKGIYFVQDLLNRGGKFLSLEICKGNIMYN